MERRGKPTMNGKNICSKIANELNNKLRSKNPIIATTINEETLRDLSCKIIYDDYILNGGTDSYSKLFAQEVPYSRITSNNTQLVFTNTDRAKLDTYFQERSHNCAIEFKCNVGNNLALPKRAGLIFNDLFRLYQIDKNKKFEGKYLVYLTDNQVETYAYGKGTKKRVFPLEVILHEWFINKEILITYDDIIKYSPCKSFANASLKSFGLNKGNLETIIQMVAHEKIYKYDLYIIEVLQNPFKSHSKTHKPIEISKAEEYFEMVDIESDDNLKIEVE